MSFVSSDQRPSRPSPSGGVAVRLGTRGSALALTQTRSVAAMLAARLPDGEFPLVEIHTEGDRDKASPLSVIGGRGVFTSALEAALLTGEIDAAVHSAKDLPSTLPDGLAIAAIPAREDPRDVLVSRHGVPLAELPANPVIGTSSRRRAFQLRRLRPDARVVELRGNLDTRLRKALATDLDGVILAAAGIARMGWLDRVTQFLPIGEFLSAPGQGALAIETRAAPDAAAATMAALDDPVLALAVRTERAFLRGVGAGCTSPVGAFAEVSPNGELVVLTAMIASDDGARFERASETYPAGDAEARSDALGRRLLAAIAGSPRGPGVSLRPLAGRRVLVTGAGSSAERLIAALREAGATPIAWPLIRIAPTAHPASLQRAVADVLAGDYDWLAVTSGNAVEALTTALASRPGWELPARVRIAAVGVETARRLRDAGLRVDVVPAEQTAAGLVASFRSVDLRDQRVLCLLGNLARPTLPDGLRDQGARVNVCEAYRTEPVTEAPDAIRRMFEDGAVDGAVDGVIFASPSAVTAFVAVRDRYGWPLDGIDVACIGPTTRRAALDHGLPVAVVGPAPSADALVGALAAHVAEDKGGHA